MGCESNRFLISFILSGFSETWEWKETLSAPTVRVGVATVSVRCSSTLVWFHVTACLPLLRLCGGGGGVPNLPVIQTWGFYLVDFSFVSSVTWSTRSSTRCPETREQERVPANLQVPGPTINIYSVLISSSVVVLVPKIPPKIWKISESMSPQFYVFLCSYKFATVPGSIGYFI